MLQIERKNPREAELQVAIAALLKGQGWRVQLEKRTPWGILDIWATKNGRLDIVEVKAFADRGYMAQALGQLLFYTEAATEARLWFASPESPSQLFMEVLQKYGVRFYTELLGLQEPIKMPQEDTYPFEATFKRIRAGLPPFEDS